MALPETALGSASEWEDKTLQEPAGISGTRLKVAARPSTVGATWMDLFHPGTPSPPSLDARVRVIADIAGALIQIHDNNGLPRPHRRHGRLTPRHLLVGVDGSASLFNAREPFSKLLPPQPDLGYLAPELLTQSGPATQQSDVFSLGVLLWEALDNGRLFPHRRAAAISRLIARRSLPLPRIEEEWALRLGEVAMKALSQDPNDRYLDATAFWLALREHLPAPDAARAALSRLAQRALKLELTTEIRDNPPYLSPSKLLGGSLPPSADAEEPPVRYSLHPERSSRIESSRPPRGFADDPAFALSDPPPRSSQLDLSRPSQLDLSRPSQPEVTRPSRAELTPAAPLPLSERRSSRPSARPPTSGVSRLERTSNAPSVRPLAAQPRLAEAESPISTLHVNLPRELIDQSLPFYVSGQPTTRTFPWGALSFAALIFFGVGAAVAFGAVTALRSTPAVPDTTRAPTSVEAAPTPAPAPVPVAPPPPAAVAPPAVSDVPSPNVAAPAEPTPAPADAPTASPAAPKAAPAPTAKASETNNKPARRRAKAKRQKLDLALPREPAAVVAPEAPKPEELEAEPYTAPSEPPAAASDTPVEQDPAPSNAAPPKDEDTAPEGELPFVDQPY
jgi:hypothetical protein